MVAAVVVTLLVVWTAIGAALALLIGRTARVADDRQQDALLIGALADEVRQPARAERTPARV